MADASGNAGHNQINDFAKSIIGLEEVKRATLEQISEAYGAAKDAGFSVKALRQVIKQEMRTAEQVAKDEEIAETVEQYKLQLKLV